MVKRTYSGADRKRGELCRKRQKSEEDDELRWPGKTPRRPQQSSSLLKNFRGSVSFELDSETEDPDSQPKKNNHLTSIFDRAQPGKLQPIKYKQNNNIYSNLKDFKTAMTDRRASAKSNEVATRSHLPTLPNESHNEGGQRLNKFFPGLGGKASSLAAQVTKPAWKREVTPKILEKTVKCDVPKQPYVPKQYAAEKVSPPRRNLSGARLSSDSKEAQLWTTNQSNSTFLRLPVNVRNQIYAIVLGGNTIKIGYDTFRSGYKHDKLNGSMPVFKYYCTVFNQLVNPYKERQQPDVGIFIEFAMFNNVCRQLYLEMAILPFALNRIAFETYSIMFNFIGHEQRLSRQQRHALKTLMVGDDLPGANILTLLPNLEKVYLAGIDQVQQRIQGGKLTGWYVVVRQEGKEPRLQMRS